MQEELALRAKGFYRKGSALTPNCVATGRQPYTAPGETMLAPVPMAIERESPSSRSIPSRAPRLASVWNITVGERWVLADHRHGRAPFVGRADYSWRLSDRCC